MSVIPAGSGNVKVVGAFDPLYEGDFPPYYPFTFFATETVWTFTAFPGPYHTFEKWTGSIGGGQTSNPLSVTVSCRGDINPNFKTRMNSVTGRMWKDSNGNGVRDTGEAAVLGRVRLFDASGNALTSWGQMDAQGYYSISPVTPGEYFLRFLPRDLGDSFVPIGQGTDTAKDSDVDATGRTVGTFTVGLENPPLSEVVKDAGVRTSSGNLTMAQARTLIASTPDLFILDIREGSLYCQEPGHLICAHSLPWTGLMSQADFQLPPPGATVLVVGEAVDTLPNHLPVLGAAALVELGYSTVYAMKDNLSLWQDAYGPRLTCAGEYLTADAGGEMEAYLNHPAILDGRESASPAAVGITGWQWVQTGGPDVALSGAQTSQAAFTPTWTGPGPVEYTFSLTVTDACGGVDTDAVTVRAAVAKGDYDGNGEVDLADAALALKVLAGMPLPENFLPEADPGPDPAVEMKDAVFILSRAAGLR